MTSEVLTVRKIAELLGGTVEGDGSGIIQSVAAVDQARPDEITFAVDERHAASLASSKAGAAIVGRGAVSTGMALIRVDNVWQAVAKLLRHLAGEADLPNAGVHPSATVAPDARLGEGVAVGPGCVIGKGARIGQATVLCANASVGARSVIGRDCLLAEGVAVKAGCVLGDRVRVGPNSVIGSEGFGYYFADGAHHRIPHIGNVVIEDDVEIGACSCVDRAKFGSTRIGAGTKIDNLVQIAHNVQIGRCCIVAGQAGLAGSARLGKGVVVMGHVGIRDHVTIGDGAQCAAFAAIASDVPDGQAVAGIPARPAREALRIMQAWNKLPDLLKTVRALETRLKALESPKDH
jgi:UDP-3-O-[3-hydroxymyristoyl] glucosamine N-acyltransferase